MVSVCVGFVLLEDGYESVCIASVVYVTDRFPNIFLKICIFMNH